MKCLKTIHSVQSEYVSMCMSKNKSEHLKYSYDDYSVTVQCCLCESVIQSTLGINYHF